MLTQIRKHLDSAPTTKKSWEREADQVYPTMAAVRVYQRWVRKNPVLGVHEQEWVDKNLQPLMSLMADTGVMRCVVPGISVYGVDRKIGYRLLPVEDVPVAHFSGNPDTGGHWRSRLPGDIAWFDPYKEYQVEGTNQFCQTFALMNLVGALPGISMDRSWGRYYTYTAAALEFIDTVIRRCLTGKEKTVFLKKIDECRTHPYRCLNVIEFPAS